MNHELPDMTKRFPPGRMDRPKCISCGNPTKEPDRICMTWKCRRATGTEAAYYARYDRRPRKRPLQKNRDVV